VLDIQICCKTDGLFATELSKVLPGDTLTGAGKLCGGIFIKSCSNHFLGPYVTVALLLWDKETKHLSSRNESLKSFLYA